MAYTQIKNLKVGDIYFDEGLTVNGDVVTVKCKLISYNGMDKYIVENDGINILVDGDRVVSTK